MEMKFLGDRNDHLRWGFSTSTVYLTIIITIIILFPITLTFFSFQSKVWLFFVGMSFYALGIFFPDMDHSKTVGGKILTKLGIDYRHRGRLHSIVSLLLYMITCSFITLCLSFVGGLEFTVWLTINGILGFLGYFNHLLCDWWFDRDNKKEVPANDPFKFWNGEKSKSKTKRK